MNALGWAFRIDNYLINKKNVKYINYFLIIVLVNTPGDCFYFPCF